MKDSLKSSYIKMLFAFLICAVMLFEAASASMTCVWCNGKGEVTCSNCGGSGAAFGGTTGSCYLCHGSGYTTCRYCNGSGRVGSDPTHGNDPNGNSGNPGNDANAGVYLSSTAMTMTVGHKAKLTLNGATRKVTWKSSNKKIATVSSKGVVNPKKKGNVTITATHAGKNFKCKIKVKKAIYATKIVLSPHEKTMLPGKTLEMDFTISPKVSKITETFKVTWSSSNTAVATVNKNGQIRTGSAGMAVITAKLKSKGKPDKKDQCKVVVKTGETLLRELLSATGNRYADEGIVITYNPSNDTYQIKEDEGYTWITMDIPASLSGVAKLNYYFTSRFGISGTDVACSAVVRMDAMPRQGNYNWVFTTGGNTTLANVSVDALLSAFNVVVWHKFGGELPDFGFAAY